MSDPLDGESKDHETPGLKGGNGAGGVGVLGTSIGGFGVRGESQANNGDADAQGFLAGVELIHGEATGVYGQSSTRGVVGHSDVGVGITGHTNSGTAVRGESATGLGFIGGTDPVFKRHAGVYGESDQTGMLGNGTTPDAIGVKGISSNGTGVVGETAGGIAVLGNSTGDGLAGKFSGDVEISGRLNATGPQGLHLNAGAVRIHGTDVLLDGRSAQSHPGQNFRALVDLDNKLVINLNGDFGDGVEIGSKLQVDGELTVAGAQSVQGDQSISGNLTVGGSMSAPSADGLHVNASSIRLHGSDFLLDGRSAISHPDQFFRALVDMDNKLIINFNGDFGLGVEVASDLVVDGRVRSRGGDCAEQFDIAAEALGEPGTVMIIGDDGKLAPCDQAYDARVAGVVSGAGDLEPALMLNERAGHRAAIALMGTVYCKVDATGAPVAAGDLMTTSATLGHAMKATDRDRSFGAVIGKALRPLPAGIGLIPILVAPR